MNHQLNQWTAEFGKKYTDRNNYTIEESDKSGIQKHGITRSELNFLFLDKLDRSIKILEVGCNIGNQLLRLQNMGFNDLYGIEPQEYAINLAKKRTSNIVIKKGNIYNIPFEDSYFDLVFTSGVLIHIPPENIVGAIKEIYRCSKNFILTAEYFSEEFTEVNYRGNEKLLWKGNYPKLFKKTFPDLRFLKIIYISELEDLSKKSVFFLSKKT